MGPPVAGRFSGIGGGGAEDGRTMVVYMQQLMFMRVAEIIEGLWKDVGIDCVSLGFGTFRTSRLIEFQLLGRARVSKTNATLN